MNLLTFVNFAINVIDKSKNIKIMISPRNNKLFFKVQTQNSINIQINSIESTNKEI